MDTEYKNGRMDQGIKGNGSREKRRDSEKYTTLMGTSTKVYSQMINSMDKGHIFIKTVRST
jgi:hypothetical protein